MKNPLRSEADAFQFLLGAVAYFGAIAIAGVINRWAGLAVFIVLSAGVLWWWLRARRIEAPRQTAPGRRGAADERRILVIANETVGGEALRERIIDSRESGYRTLVLVVCPALNSPLRHWASDEDQAREHARERLQSSLRRLREAGIEAEGEIGDGDPLQAIEDALRTFGPDEIIISTHPEGRSHWLERGVVTGARERFAVPITHVVTDLEAERD